MVLRHEGAHRCRGCERQPDAPLLELSGIHAAFPTPGATACLIKAGGMDNRFQPRRPGPQPMLESLSASTRQRDSVAVCTFIYRDTRSNVALSVGSNRVTALALKAIDHLAMRRPRDLFQGNYREGNCVDAVGVYAGLGVSGFFTDGKIDPVFNHHITG